MDYVLLLKRMRGRLLDVKMCREGRRMADHFLVEARTGIPLEFAWKLRSVER